MGEIEICVYGRVQGVGFRQMVKSFADRTGLKGFVQNKDDGSVLIVSQGEEDKIQQLLSWINSNPGMSKVEMLNYNKREIKKNYPEFKLLREHAFFKDQAKSFINLGKRIIGIESFGVPEHIAIIPDGNRRWARERGMEESLGHYKASSYESLKNLLMSAKDLGVKYVTLWGFSTENWKRSKGEIDFIFDIVKSNIENFRKDAHKNKLRFRHIGRKDRLPKDLVNELDKIESETKKYDKFNIQLALDYGGRDEIIRAVNKIVKADKKTVDEKDFYNYLDTNGIPDVDLIIRTGGEKRISGLMPFQGAYAEYYFTDIYFPDFSIKELRKAVQEYGKRQRRFGGNSK